MSTFRDNFLRSNRQTFWGSNVNIGFHKNTVVSPWKYKLLAMKHVCCKISTESDRVTNQVSTHQRIMHLNLGLSPTIYYTEGKSQILGSCYRIAEVWSLKYGRLGIGTVVSVEEGKRSPFVCTVHSPPQPTPTPHPHPLGPTDSWQTFAPLSVTITKNLEIIVYLPSRTPTLHRPTYIPITTIWKYATHLSLLRKKAFDVYLGYEANYLSCTRLTWWRSHCLMWKRWLTFLTTTPSTGRMDWRIWMIPISIAFTINSTIYWVWRMSIILDIP